MFTVPRDGDGLYYFSVFVVVNATEYGFFDMELNDNIVCTVEPIDDNGNNRVSSSCSAVVRATAGDEVKIVYDVGTDTTPLFTISDYPRHGFNGFRI